MDFALQHKTDRLTLEVCLCLVLACFIPEPIKPNRLHTVA